MTDLRIFTVLKAGGEYRALHVHALKAQILKRLPDARFVCLTDMDVPGVECIALKHGWAGWWSKMELLRPDIEGRIFYLDLDTIITGALEPVVAVERLTLLREFRRRETGVQSLGSGLMMLPQADRAAPWADFSSAPAQHMVTHAIGGDQHFLNRHFLPHAARWQDVVNGIYSWKTHCTSGNAPNLFGRIPPDARIVCFHGPPRPWAVPAFRALYSATHPAEAT
jgi:hypothetical protein